MCVRALYVCVNAHCILPPHERGWLRGLLYMGMAGIYSDCKNDERSFGGSRNMFRCSEHTVFRTQCAKFF